MYQNIEAEIARSRMKKVMFQKLWGLLIKH